MLLLLMFLAWAGACMAGARAMIAGAEARKTARRSGFFPMCHFTRTANIQGVRWWVLVSGLRDPNKVLWRYAFAPFTMLFTFIPYLRRDFDPLHGLTRIYPGFFNRVDILNRTREMQFVAFETLIEVLDSFGIDTADLKQQKGNILNINVSGGGVAFGAVSQGDHGHVDGHAVLTSEQVDQHYRAAEDALRKLSAEYEKTGAERQAAMAAIAALKAEATSPEPDVAKGSGLLRAARENFSWACPAIKDFAKSAWPLLLAAIGS